MNAAATENARRTGRRIGSILFALFIGTFTIVCSAQVLYQGFRSTRVTQTSVQCRVGLRGLIVSLRRARAAAAAESGGERTSLKQFRDALGPEWEAHDAVLRSCARDEWALRALDQIDRLRWAEEHAVRYESVELAPSRQRVLAIEQSLGAQTNNSE
jgi:hypothetical protein